MLPYCTIFPRTGRLRAQVISFPFVILPAECSSSSSVAFSAPCPEGPTMSNRQACHSLVSPQHCAHTVTVQRLHWTANISILGHLTPLFRSCAWLERVSRTCCTATGVLRGGIGSHPSVLCDSSFFPGLSRCPQCIHTRVAQPASFMISPGWFKAGSSARQQFCPWSTASTPGSCQATPQQLCMRSWGQPVKRKCDAR